MFSVLHLSFPDSTEWTSVDAVDRGWTESAVLNIARTRGG